MNNSAHWLQSLINCELILAMRPHLEPEIRRGLLFEIVMLKNAMTSDTALESLPDVERFVRRFSQILREAKSCAP